MPDLQLWLVSPDRVEGDGIEWFGVVRRRAAGPAVPVGLGDVPAQVSYEGFGRPYVEAMAAKTAIVATPNPGAQEVLDGGRYSLIVEDDDLGPALCRLLTNHEERQALAARGFERSRAFAWDRVVDRYEAIYGTVLERRGHRRAA